MPLALLASVAMSAFAHVSKINRMKDFEQETANGITVVKFSATWCPPCQRLAPYFDKLSEDAAYSNVKFIAVDRDSGQQIANKFRVSSIPAIVFLDNGTKVGATMVGIDMGNINNTVNQIKKRIDSLLKKQ